MANKSENKDLVLFPQEQPLADQPLLFEGVYIRHEWVTEEEDWFFSAVDVCNVLADSRSKDPGAYWRKLKQRLATEGSEVVTNCHGLKLVASDGKKYLTDCFSTKGLKKENLRDNMTNLELVLNMLAEVSTTAISRTKKPDTFTANKQVAREGGNIARDARLNLEKTIGESVVSPLNAKDKSSLEIADVE